ncbi:site-specific integrase [Trinickia violacea]|uniref:Site-specific integrase n=1 Tax=Trinickia violacea TaxID=2571746 RepID=A0A4P8IN00_9BURK|nr:site-specific integrase [Trinickia violacea]QCP48253.1 site-specific integrase [Trinickia violacea]
MKKHRNFSDLHNVRYHVKLCHNEGESDSWQLFEGQPEPEMQQTYREVITRRKYELLGSIDSPDSTETQVFRNHLSTLHSFLAFFGKTEDSSVGREMLHSFDDKLQAYLDSLSVAPRTKSDRRSHLRAWQRSLMDARQPISLDAAALESVAATSSSSFHLKLREAISASGLAPKTIARRAGASMPAIQRWMKGAFPNRRAFPSVHRIEAELGMPRDALLALVPQISREAQARSSQIHKIKIAYRERQRENTKNQYILHGSQLTTDCLKEWDDLYDYKTERTPRLERSTRGSWRVLPLEKIVEKLPPYALRGNRGCVAAKITMNMFRSFDGFLALPKDRGGRGVALNDAQTLAWLAVPKAIDSYLDFKSDRSGGLIHKGHENFCKMGASMTHPQTGYLTQQPDFAKKLPDGTLSDSWGVTCANAYRLYRRWMQDAKDTSRKPYEPIQGLLNLAEPLGPLVRAVDELDQLAAQAAPGSLAEARYKRDALLLSMLMANPLRSRNFKLMTWNENGTGSLYQRENGQWRLRFSAGDFKNDRHAKKTDYDAPLPSALSDRIEEYLFDYRPRLVRDNPACAKVFPGQTGNTFHGLNKHVFQITQRHIPETPGFGPHAVRHLVATDWLRTHPNDFLTAAQLLHDKLETVLKDYAHLRQDEAFARFEEHLNAVGHAMKN